MNRKCEADNMNFFPIGTRVGTVEVVNTGKINPMLLLLPLLIRFIHSPLIITTKNSHICYSVMMTCTQPILN